MRATSRREFLRTGAATAVAAMAAGSLGRGWGTALAGLPAADDVPQGARAPQAPTVDVLLPRDRVPLSFIIDDSTCLVNMGHFCMPQFRAAWPQNPIYAKRWKDWPREIPDSFLREFGEFCAAQGVRGKYSLVPYPACVGWLDRDLPGWSRAELRDSLKLVRELMVPNWDITPEMITHTRVIDLKTGRPMAEMNPATMENSYPPQKQSADELAAYIAYALRILKNCEIPCRGITTPGGFGNKCKSELSLAVRQAVTDVFDAEIPFYFKYISEGAESAQPRLEHVQAADTDSPRLVVNVPAGTGDWFGNWDGDQPPQGQKYINDDATAGRMVELIQRREPAIMFGHWAGLYSNGSKRGFDACRKVILTVNQGFADRTVWMTTSELARYWAAKSLTRIERDGDRVSLAAPFACPAYTLAIKQAGGRPPTLVHAGKPIALNEVTDARRLAPGTWLRQPDRLLICFDLPKGNAALSV
ncbi:MAG TPA: hypothetical protein VH475_04440 [Tepidisphaeraceae bacterium]|jgi:hypothetical protein